MSKKIVALTIICTLSLNSIIAYADTTTQSNQLENSSTYTDE